MHTQSSRRSRLAGASCVLVVAGMLAGCASSPTPTPASTLPAAASPAATAPTSLAPTAPAATPSPTLAPTPVPSPTPVAKALCGSAFKGCPETAGTYTTAPFGAPFTFTIGSGWTNDANFPDAGSVSTKVGSFGWFVSLKASDSTGKPVKTGTTPDALVAFLRTLKGFTVGPTTPVTIAGATGEQVDVDSNKQTDNFILIFNESGIGMRANSRFRMMFFDRDGTTVMLGLETDAAKDFGGFATSSQSILDSLAWQ